MRDEERERETRRQREGQRDRRINAIESTHDWDGGGADAKTPCSSSDAAAGQTESRRKTEERPDTPEKDRIRRKPPETK